MSGAERRDRRDVPVDRPDRPDRPIRADPADSADRGGPGATPHRTKDRAVDRADRADRAKPDANERAEEGALARAFSAWSRAQNQEERTQALRGLLVAARAELAAAWVASLGASAAEALRQRFAGRDEAFQQVLLQLARVSGTELPVCIEGERGTGRSRLALAIHQTGLRRAGPFVVVEAADLVAPLEEDLRERWAAAAGGTLFVCGDGLPPAAQGELARLLEEPSGAPRLVVALEAIDADPALQPELARRLRILRLRLSPLRADPDALRRAFLASVRRAGGAPARVSPGALERVVSYGWPGNARQLEACAQRIVELADGADVDRAHVEQVLRAQPQRPRRPTSRRLAPARPNPASAPESAPASAPESTPKSAPLPREGALASDPPSGEAGRSGTGAAELSLDEHERDVIAARLRAYDWHQQRAAESLGIDRKTLRRKIQRYGLEPE